MSEFNEYLGDEEKAIIIQQRIKQFASEGYQQELNLDLAKKSDNTEVIEQIEESIKMIKKAIDIQKEMLESLDLSSEG